MKKILRLISVILLSVFCVTFSACGDKDVLGVAEKEQKGVNYRTEKCNLSAQELNSAVLLYSSGCEANGASLKDGYMSGMITASRGGTSPVYDGTGSDLALYLSEHVSTNTGNAYFKVYISSNSVVQCWYSETDSLKNVTYSKDGGYSVTDKDNVFGGYPTAAAAAAIS